MFNSYEIVYIRTRKRWVFFYRWLFNWGDHIDRI